MNASCLLDSSSHLNLLQRVFWRLPWLSHVIHKKHATAIQFLQSRGGQQQYLCRRGEKDTLKNFFSSDNGRERQDPGQLTLEL